MMNNSVLILIENDNEKVSQVVYEIVQKSLELKMDKIYGVCITKSIKKLEKELNFLPFDKIVYFEGLDSFDSKIYADCFVDAVRLLSPSAVLIGGTPIGKSTAALASGILETGLTADCTDLQMDEKGRIIQIRPAFGGNIIAEIITEFARPQMATIRPNTFQPYRPQIEYKPILMSGSILPRSSYEIMNTTVKKSSRKISEYDFVVVVGNAIKNKKDIEPFEAFTESIGGVLCSTRALVERGIMPGDKQIGLSGSYISPKVLITFGVSGSIQFLSGVRSADTIIAVNTDKDCRMFSVAHYPILADMYEVIQIL
ncbi:electron transfer flavoprotein subunit alpha/FixB family protein [Vallitalea okinawensis]|uniref:electron transfer flavoprotein subunit alpha/FixB family protein n=1 Tax=Vallitalea okinawensis TaxID=2078660 RepID=UPI000CFDC8A0|nr:electron transfer flavoprotein subunit alpha/FixB family protein [Vallitalea okinawensis]